jgi:hypothetical protein
MKLRLPLAWRLRELCNEPSGSINKGREILDGALFKRISAYQDDSAPLSYLAVIIFSRDRVTIDAVGIGNWSY